jgi:hypothetical protein
MAKVLTPQQGLDKVGLNVEQVTKRIIRSFNKATAKQMTEGLWWYSEATELVEYLSGASIYTVDQVAAAMAHLSPRLRWSQNVDSVKMLVLDGELPSYVMSGPAGRARRALEAADPELTFGKKAKKTLNFSRNCSGCVNSVTVDVWAAKVVGVSEDQLKLVGVYEAIAHCYRLAAKRVGVHPAQMQAITWIVVRGSAT